MRPDPTLLRVWLPLVLLVLACHSETSPPGGLVVTTSGAASTAEEPTPTTGSMPTRTSSATTGTTSTGPGSTSTSGPDLGAGPGASTSETTVSSPTCGDGHLDPGEACDLGPQNDDHGACTVTCEAATCGDGLVWEGEESCDHGPGNNDTLYGGCTTQCQHGPRCQDGIVQGPEECDLGDGNNTGEFPVDGVPCDGCRFAARIAFLTSVAYKGGELGGVDGAHLKCRALAKQAGLDNSANFAAWLSDAQHSPLADFKHGPDTADLPYVRPDGVRVADDWDDLISNGPRAGIAVTETGELQLNKYVWTGTAASGGPFDPAATCKAWSSSKPIDQSRFGISGVAEQDVQAWAQWITDRQWTSNKSSGCHYVYQLYCVEQ